MKIYRLVLCVIVVLACGSTFADVDMNFLESEMPKLKEYRYSQGGINFAHIVQQVAEASIGPERDKVEQLLIDSVKEVQTYDAREFLCRQLRTIGTARSVPALEKMLADPRISHMARYALVKIDSPEAGAALQRALPETSGRLKSGIVSAIVNAEYRPALGDILKLVGDKDRDVATAAVRAAGHFGGPASHKALVKARESADKGMKVEIDAAVLQCAEIYMRDGKKSEADRIWKSYYAPEYAQHLRIASLKGLIELGEGDGLELLSKAVSDDDPGLQRSAIQMLAGIKGEKITRMLVDLLGSSSPGGQALILGTFETRGDSSAVPVIIKSASSEHEEVRIAALIALGGIGDGSAVEVLAKAAASGQGRERLAARANLIRITGEGVDKAFVQAAKAGDEKFRRTVIRALGSRADRAALPELFRIARADEITAIRDEAITTIGTLGKAADVEEMIALAISPREARDRRGVGDALSRVFNRADDVAFQSRSIIAAIKNAPDEAKPALISTLDVLATTEALAVVRSCVNSPNKDIRDAAARSMVEWPNTDPVEDIYQVAATSEVESHRVLALRGYLRLARLSGDATAMYANAMKVARKEQEIKQVLSGLSYDDTLESYELVCQYLDKEEFKSDACLAAVKIMSNYCWEDREKAKIEFARLIDGAPNDEVKKIANQTLENLDRMKGYILAWRVAGPYVKKGCKDGQQVFQTEFEPEKNSSSRDVQWIKMVKKAEHNRIDLQATFGDMDYCCAYARTYIWSPEAQRVKMQASADDYIRGWINGKKIEGEFELQKGRNTFMVKVGDHGGGWLFNCGLVKPDGAEVRGLRFEAGAGD